MAYIYNELMKETRKRVMRLWKNHREEFGDNGDSQYEAIRECFMRAVRYLSRKYHISLRLDEDQTYWYDDYYTDVIESMSEELLELS